MFTKKQLKEQISQGNKLNISSYLEMEYEEAKEKLVDLQSEDEIKRTQGIARYLRDLIKLTSEKK
jgi:hypothetical protein